MMGTFEAMEVLLAKINNLDPKNVSKIIGYILISHQETELPSLASSPDHVLYSLVLKIKQHLGLSSTPFSPSPSSSSLNPIPRPSHSLHSLPPSSFSNSSQFVHGALTDAVVGSPSIAQHQRGDAVMMGDEFHKFSQCSTERNNFMANVSAKRPVSPCRRIYISFPPKSTFKHEDAFEYFSKFGPVQDVRIPHQLMRMFGFVTFVYPESVKLILSKDNPHFISGSRVRVNPYKEKVKVSDKTQQQQLERGEFSPCLIPPGLDSREPYDAHPGARRLYNPHEIRYLEGQAELQQLQGRRPKNLQLPDMKNNHIVHHQRSLSVGASLPLPQIYSGYSKLGLSSGSIKGDITAASAAHPHQEVDPACIHHGTDNENRKDSTDHWNSVEKALLPGGLFSSPTNAAGYNLCDFSTLAEVNKSGVFSTSSVASNKLQPQNNSNDKASNY